MASFSFGEGNKAKILSIPLYVAGRVLSIIVPRRRDAWVFGCGAGIGDGALALWHVAADRGHRALWLVGSDAEARAAGALGIPNAAKNSVRGLWATLRARVIVITHGFGDVNRYGVDGAVIVQLWHGIPLKRIGLDSPETVRSDILARSPIVRLMLAAMYRRAARRIQVMPAASHLVRGRLESAFALSDARVPVTGEPRVDVLSQRSAADRRADARAAIAAAVGSVGTDRLVLYAPTWRDGDADPAVPSTAEWAQLQSLLTSHDAALLVRSHPLGSGDYTPPPRTDRIRMLDNDRVADVTPLLPGLEVLVTDYSSLVYDCALVPLPVVFLAPDADAYARRRGFYGSYRDVTADRAATDWAGVIAQLNEVLGDPDERDRRVGDAQALSARVHDFRDGANATRVYRAIVARLDTRTPASKGPA